MSKEEDQKKIYNTQMSKAYNKGEKEKSIEIAKKMLQNNKSISEISEYTGLTAKEIESLK